MWRNASLAPASTLGVAARAALAVVILSGCAAASTGASTDASRLDERSVSAAPTPDQRPQATATPLPSPPVTPTAPSPTQTPVATASPTPTLSPLAAMENDEAAFVKAARNVRPELDAFPAGAVLLRGLNACQSVERDGVVESDIERLAQRYLCPEAAAPVATAAPSPAPPTPTPALRPTPTALPAAPNVPPSTPSPALQPTSLPTATAVAPQATAVPTPTIAPPVIRPQILPPTPSCEVASAIVIEERCYLLYGNPDIDIDNNARCPSQAPRLIESICYTDVGRVSYLYENCSAAPGPILIGEAGYRPDLDADSDGIACEDS